MSNSKISALTSATTPLAGTETLPVVQSSTTKQVSVANLTDGRAVNALSLQLTSSVGNVEPLVLSSGSIGTVGNTIGIRAGYTGTTYQKGGLIYQSADGNGRGAWNICCQNGANSSNVTISDSILKIDYSGDVTYKIGNLVQGTAAKGINFTANTPAAGMTSQLLNWYEEGTFTPAFIADTTNPTVTYSTQSGSYTRIGNTVTFAIALIVNTISGGSGNLRVSGLPFVNSSGLSWAATRAFVYNWVINPTVFVVGNGSNTVLIYTSDVSNTVATPASLQASSYFFISGTYKVS